MASDQKFNNRTNTHTPTQNSLCALAGAPNAHKLLPFVLLSYGQQSRYLWTDDNGVCHEVLQGEGGEQGDALAPALFALAQHDALVAASAHLQEGEFLAAFLDDLYIVTTPERARAAFDSTAAAVAEHKARVKRCKDNSKGLLRLSKPKVFSSRRPCFSAHFCLPEKKMKIF